MERSPVASSDIEAVGYDARGQALEIAFHSGGVYQYAGVPASVDVRVLPRAVFSRLHQGQLPVPSRWLTTDRPSHSLCNRSSSDEVVAFLRMAAPQPQRDCGCGAAVFRYIQRDP